MNSRLLDLDLTDERLREWGYFFRDRRRLETCRSIENRFRATSEDFNCEGWGDMDSAPSVRPARPYQLLRALETHEAVMGQQVIYRWVITYAYAYPNLPRFVVLRCIKKFTGRRLTWRSYLDALDIAMCRVHTTLSSA